MRILVLGAGKMGSFFVDLLSFDHETAVYDIDAKRLRFTYNTQRFTSLEEIDDFKPELVINAVTLKYTLDVFRTVIPHLPPECILSDIASGNQRVHLGGSVVEYAVHTHQQACRLGAIILLRHIHLHRALATRIYATLLMLETLYCALRRHLRLHCKRHQACYECY